MQLPFLQCVLSSFSIAPLLVGTVEPEAVSEVLDLIWGGDETLILVSSDLSHYLDYETARRLDLETSNAIAGLRHEEIRPQQACGHLAIKGLLQSARLQPRPAQLRRYRRPQRARRGIRRLHLYSLVMFHSTRRHPFDALRIGTDDGFKSKWYYFSIGQAF